MCVCVCICICGFPDTGGTPIAEWLIMEQQKITWITLGYPDVDAPIWLLNKFCDCLCVVKFNNIWTKMYLSEWWTTPSPSMVYFWVICRKILIGFPRSVFLGSFWCFNITWDPKPWLGSQVLGIRCWDLNDFITPWTLIARTCMNFIQLNQPISWQ